MESKHHILPMLLQEFRNNQRLGNNQGLGNNQVSIIN